MAEAIQFELVSPERLLLSEAVSEVIVPGVDGQFGVLSGHSPFMTTMRPGILKVRGVDGALTEYFVRGGFADVAPDGGLTILAENAVAVDDLDGASLEQQIKDAEEDVADAHNDESRHKSETLLSQLKEVQEALQNA